MKNVNIKSNSWFFELTGVTGVNLIDINPKWYEIFKKRKYGIELTIMYDEHDFDENKIYVYDYKFKKNRDMVLNRFLEMDFDDFKRDSVPYIEFDFEV